MNLEIFFRNEIYFFTYRNISIYSELIQLTKIEEESIERLKFHLIHILKCIINVLSSNALFYE